MRIVRILGLFSIADVVVVIVADENRVDPSQSRISATGYRNAWIVENSDSRRVFKQQCAVESAELTRPLADGSDADRLVPGMAC